MSALLSVIVGIVCGMFAEYWGHRLEHWRIFRPMSHSIHHMGGSTHGWVREFFANIKYAAFPLAVVGLAVSYFDVHVALWIAAGFLAHLAFSAYAHELTHTDASLVFWARPIHYFHHENRQWRHNFGITNTLFDRLFGTFLDDPTWARKPVRVRDLFSAKWI